MARKVVYDKVEVRGPVVLMAFPMNPDTKQWPAHPQVDASGREIVNVCQLVQQNKNNRLYKPALMNRYSDNILLNEWAVELPITIYIDKFGDMHNGQHCCRGLERAEAERVSSPENEAYYSKEMGHKNPLYITAVLVTGIDPKDADYLDLGKNRNHADVEYRKHEFDDVTVAVTTKDGIVNQTISASQQNRIAAWTATAAKIVWFRLWHGEKVRSPRRFPHSSLNEVLKLYPAIRQSARLVFEQNEGSDGGISKLMNPAYMIALHFLATYSDAEMQGAFREHADYLVDVLANGSMNEPQAPFYELREWLISQGKGKGNDGLNRLYDAVVFAWNQYLEQKKITDRKVFNRLKTDEFYCMGGLDTPPTPEPEIEHVAADAPATPAAATPAPAVAAAPAAPPATATAAPAAEPKPARKPRKAKAEAAAPPA